MPRRIAILQQTSGQAPLTAGVVVLDHRARTAGPLEVTADVVGGHAAHCGAHAVAVTVVGEAGAGRAAYGRQAVFDQYTSLGITVCAATDVVAEAITVSVCV